MRIKMQQFIKNKDFFLWPSMCFEFLPELFLSNFWVFQLCSLPLPQTRNFYEINYIGKIEKFYFLIILFLKINYWILF